MKVFYWRYAAIGAALTFVWVGYKVLTSGIPWEGEGIIYNVSRWAGGMIFGGAIGAAVALIRNRFWK